MFQSCADPGQARQGHRCRQDGEGAPFDPGGAPQAAWRASRAHSLEDCLPAPSSVQNTLLAGTWRGASVPQTSLCSHSAPSRGERGRQPARTPGDNWVCHLCGVNTHHWKIQPDTLTPGPSTEARSSLQARPARLQLLFTEPTHVFKLAFSRFYSCKKKKKKGKE